jgi:hypothetical protein
VDEILVDGRQIRRENFVQQVDDAFFGFHVISLPSPARVAIGTPLSSFA